jgi:PAS domain S-box-containing protein
MVMDQSAEVLRLRATVRDLLALSIIPEAWVAREPPAIAADLADLLIGSLKLDFAFVRLCGPRGCQAVEVIRGDCWKAFPDWLQQHLAKFGQVSRTEIVTNVGGVEKSCCGVVIPIGVNSERGLIAAACDRSDFPDQIDQQMLSATANNAATAFQNAHLINELRTAQKTLRDQEQELRKAHDELEVKVAERTSELRRRERELRDVIDTIPAIVWSALPDGSNTYANRRFVEYSGLSAEQTAGSGWRAAIHPDDFERHIGKWTEAAATGTPHESEVRFRRSDGQYRWHLDRGVPLRDEDGNIVKWYGIVTDIEDRKRAGETLEVLSRDLQESKAKLEEAQRITHVGYWEWDVATNGIKWSDETYRIYGMRPQECPMDLATVREKIHPEDWGVVFRALEEALSGGAHYNAECRVFRPTGEVRIIDSQGHVKRDTSGRPTLMFGTVQDITDRKRAEQRLRESEAYLAEAQRLSQTGSWAWNPATGDIRYWSEMCYCVLGFDPAGRLPRFEEFFHRIHPDDQAATRERFEKAIRDKADFELDYRIVHPEKGIRDIHVVGHAVLDGSSILEFVGTVIDITELKSAEQERERLRQLEADLAHVNRVSTLGEMAASLAHEIKQPIAAAITSANSCIEWLAHEPPNLDRARAAAARIDKYGNRATEIIDRIRSLYRKSPPRRELVDMNGIIQEMLTLLNGEATRHSVGMGTELAAELPKITADRVQLQQVFMNLMLNAIEAMKDCGGELTVKSELQDGQLLFSVSDTGVGLPKEKMEEIFSAFFTTKPQGSGMGLSISRSIVESHGGRLWATANDGRGATFHFTLPAHMTETSSQVNL